MYIVCIINETKFMRINKKKMCAFFANKENAEVSIYNDK